MRHPNLECLTPAPGQDFHEERSRTFPRNVYKSICLRPAGYEFREMIPMISIIVNGETREAVSGVIVTQLIGSGFAEAARRLIAT